MISAQVIEDSIAPHGKRLTTLELQYPRCIHGELLTHRVFSRNAMSSRAVPVAKMIEQVRSDPFKPHVWGMNQAGMQARTVADGKTEWSAKSIWLDAAEDASKHAEKLMALGIAKQIVNRLLEPFQWMRTIVTASEWENFFELRDHEDAEPHFQMLAREVRKEMDDSEPTLRACEAYTTANWHLPYVLWHERTSEGFLQLAKVSAARCARVSYLTHDNQKPSLEADIALFNRLVGSRPIHASPVEHQAFPLGSADAISGNFVGWMQFRKLLVE